ncbi:efflux RND transporter periplasmic adaptor subunit [Singulisphaera sp. PoT]|uniref:efflux RND transporter periplasmic adaptor subunit n=1 Tax=Singulisphaera sp. PoT TaxID=3411797 RepID=UPI003BF5C699
MTSELAPAVATRAPRGPWRACALLLGLALLATLGCEHGGKDKAAAKQKAEAKDSGEGKTAGIRVVQPERRDIKMTVVQPGTIQAFETTSMYSRIAGYINKYNYNIGDQVKKGDILLDMWIPDLVEEYDQKTAAVKRARVQIQVVESALRAADARLETAKARVISAEAGVKRAQASYTRWLSEYKRLETLVENKVLDVQVRDETYRQYEEASAGRDQANAMVSEMTSARDQATADRDRARVDIDAAKADLEVALADQRQAKVLLDYGQIKAPYNGVITQRNISPGDYLQPGGGSGGQSRPLFVLEQVDPVRVFVGVPELASSFINVNDTAIIRFQAIPGASREGKVVRSGFSLNPTTRTLQTEIDVPNSDGHLHPGWYVTVTITVSRKQVWTLPSNAISFQGGQNYSVFLEVDGKPVRTQILIGPSDDTHTEILKKHTMGKDMPFHSNTNDWPEFDGTERIHVGNLDALAEAQAEDSKKPAK